mmetsp:Transcript_101360/g.326720  ORF Transcript_101360/g.326720 Transcript_101360/m.326720 type:complete len:89 (-) Transcript_101360:119-385(-)
MAPSLLPPDVSPTLPSQQHWSPSTAGGHLSAQLRGELDELLAETRHRALSHQHLTALSLLRHTCFEIRAADATILVAGPRHGPVFAAA